MKSFLLFSSSLFRSGQKNIGKWAVLHFYYQSLKENRTASVSASLMKCVFSNLMKWRRHLLNECDIIKECDKFATYREGNKNIYLPRVIHVYSRKIHIRIEKAKSLHPHTAHHTLTGYSLSKTNTREYT